MTEEEYREKQTQDTNQLKKTFDAGYRKGRKEGIEEALASFNLIAPGKDVSVDMIRQAIAERLKEQKP